eukprot:8723855-Karenia_brevis.AAC.1
MIVQAGTFGKGSQRKMCDHVVLLGDFNTRFQTVVSGVVEAHGVDHDFGYYAHRRHALRSETLVD